MLFDISKCFDSQWPSETMNDLFEVSKQNENLKIISESNKNVSISIKTPFGQTKRKIIKEVEMQGSVWGPIKCSVQIDTIGKECLQKRENVYSYKKLVNIPPLSFIDDIIGFAECGHPSVKLNCFINSKIEMKRLEFSDTKCHQIHVGTSKSLCPSLNVHGKIMKTVDYDKYLGDIISSDSSNTKNIESKVSKAIGIISQIMALLNEVSLGSHYFKIALMLREAFFYKWSLDEFGSMLWAKR